MPDPVWPESLPTPLLQGYKVNDELPLIRTKMESGPDRVTRTSTSFMSNVGFSILLSSAQRKTLRSWFENAANAGADWVSMPVDTGSGIAFHRCRIVAGLSWQPINSKTWRVNFKIETDERIEAYE